MDVISPTNHLSINRTGYKEDNLIMSAIKEVEEESKIYNNTSMMESVNQS
jgi:hypothetical protein